MKKLIFLLVAMMPFLAFGQKAKIEFKETTHHFGTINENDGEAICEFSYTNTGNAPLILTNVRAGCGCTTPEWQRQPVAPGESGKIKVAYNPKNRPGSFIKSITVNSNAETPVVSLTIRGSVTRKPANPMDAYRYAAGPLKMTDNSMNLGAVKNTAVAEKQIELINPKDTPLHVEVAADGPYIDAKVEKSTLNKGEKTKLTVKFDAAKKNDWGFVTEKVHLKANNEPVGDITLTANIEEDFSKYEGDFSNAPSIQLSEENANLTDLEKNSSYTHEFYIQNTGKSDLIIRKVRTSDQNISVNVAKHTIKPGKKVKATFILKTGPVSKIIKLIQFTVNDPQKPLVTYKINGSLK